ncbi:MAG: hypothetical protein JSS81_29560 [Acidobacteria bacterium]|nr:hypothetical protein [Acidobacteriota bacterium]
MRNVRTFILLAILISGGCAKPPDAAENSNAAVAPPTISPAVDGRAAKLAELKKKIAPFFELMGPPRKNDWLASFKEPGQTFEEYTAGNPTLPTAARRTIYIQPAGDFTPLEKRVLDLTAEYMRVFYGLPVKMNAPLSLAKVPPAMRRKNPLEGHEQIKAGYFLDDVLPKLLPADAAAFICLTNVDLYPDENWNFVFGQANLETRVGVWSMKRFGRPEKSAEDYMMFLGRTLKVAMHETGHMFSMQHCTKYVCLMSGSNNLPETDRQPLDVCPECMAKIAWGLDYPPAKRYRALAAFWKKLGWRDEEKTSLAKAAAVESAQ